jgi:nitrite reductase/ring-hydroxylating ferredoxin subunit
MVLGRDDLGVTAATAFDLLVDARRVHRRVYTDPDVFEAEMARIFGRVWVYVAHESEVREPGDYKTSWIGRQPVIVTRDEDHRLHVLFNRCTHRAATVCQERSGTANYFRCGYHGWTFRNDGTLIGATFGSGYDDEDFCPDEFGLGSAPRVASYRGFIFASLAPEGPSLAEHLGNAMAFLDLLVDLSPTGEIYLGAAGQHHYGYPGNWKLQAENGVDGYHPNFVHQAFLEGASRSGAAMRAFGAGSAASAADLGNGHALLDLRPIMGDVHEKVFLSTPDGAELFGRLANRLGPERAREVIRCNGAQGFNLLVFPNLLIIQAQVRVVHPRRVDQTDVDLYPTMLGGVPDSLNATRLRMHESFYGPAGGGAPGDLEMFRRVQEGLKVESVEWLALLRGLRRTQLGPAGELIGHVSDEHPQRAFYRRWAEEMRR